MSELKPCPFCGETRHVHKEWINPKEPEPCEVEELYELAWCEICGVTVMQDWNDWNTRPIEDDLRKRIAELENEHNVWLIRASNAVKNLETRIAEFEAAQRWHVVKECNDVATPIDVALRKRIAELEGKIDQLTAHDATERQDDKWIPVSERLPEAYEKVIALAKDCMNVDWVLPKELREVGKGAFARLYNVTHWMPLPEPPIVYGKVCEE